ncbi:YiaA/YiaB family inner membrane protein [Xenorhabdus doucetiae]|nr:YiaA/YiaB family inner membrane protein [Xenorhabdus doucetiae]
MAIDLFNPDLLPSEKGFYEIAFFLCLFGSIVVQKILGIWSILNHQ